MPHRRKTILQEIFYLVVFCVFTLTVFTFFMMREGRQISNSNVDAGIKYIELKEQENPQIVHIELLARQKALEEALEAQEQAKEKEIRDQEIEKALNSADGSIWDLFINTVILGDSRVEAFANYAFLGSDHVFYNKGDTIRNILDWKEELQQLNPKHIVFSYGINDVGIGYWETGEEYSAEFKSILDELQTILPETKFYISSIFVAIDPAFEVGPAWREIPSFNVAIKEMCEGTDYIYIDNTDIAEAHKDLYDQDGVHFYWEFYPYWASNILKALIW